MAILQRLRVSRSSQRSYSATHCIINIHYYLLLRAECIFVVTVKVCSMLRNILTWPWWWLLGIGLALSVIHACALHTARRIRRHSALQFVSSYGNFRKRRSPHLACVQLERNATARMGQWMTAENSNDLCIKAQNSMCSIGKFYMRFCRIGLIL